MEENRITGYAKIREYDGDYFERLVETLNSLSRREIQSLIDRFSSVIHEERNIFVIGNGGSAATASHLATDIGIGLLRVGLKSRIVSLRENSAILSAVGNDTDFRLVFASQLRVVANKGDLLVVISASGNSENLVEAISRAKDMKLHTVALVGFDGGVIKGMVDTCVHVPTAIGEYGIVEDIHLSLTHLLKEELIKDKLLDENEFVSVYFCKLISQSANPITS